MDDTESDEETYEQLQLPGMEDPKYTVDMTLPPGVTVATTANTAPAVQSAKTYSNNTASSSMPNSNALSMGLHSGMDLTVALNTVCDRLMDLRVENSYLKQTMADWVAQQALQPPPRKPGRKAKLMVQPDTPGVCGLDPDRDDVSCPDAGVYRYQQGCKGTACVASNTKYYAQRRQSKDVTD